MKLLSIFTTITNPIERGDLYNEAMECYNQLADEVIVIDGKDTWPKEFSWPLIGQHFQKGYEACTGDWVIHADLDFIFHERSFEQIRKVLEQNNDSPALTFYKWQFILPDRYTLKSRLTLAVNKAKYGDRIRFDSGGDLCQPSLDGEYLNPDYLTESKINFYNYEKILKTKEQIAEDSGRMDRAYFRHFNKYQMGSDGSNESAYLAWLKMTVGRFYAREQKQISLDEHPKCMQETIKLLKPEQFGYNGHNNLEVNKYV